MAIRELLKADFGIDVRIARGIGQRSDPYVVEECTAPEAVRTQLDLLKGLGRGRREFWRLLDVESSEAVGPTIQAVRIEAVQFTEREIITETRAVYFDIAAVRGQPDASIPLIEWLDHRTSFRAPSQIGWLHFDRTLNNAHGEGRLDTSLFYSAPQTKSTIYVYDIPASGGDKNGELSAVCRQVEAQHPQAEKPWPDLIKGPFLLQHFIIGDTLSVAGVATLGCQFVKLRLTYVDDPKMRDLMSRSVDELATLVTAAEFPTH